PLFLAKMARVTWPPSPRGQSKLPIAAAISLPRPMENLHVIDGAAIPAPNFYEPATPIACWVHTPEVYFSKVRTCKTVNKSSKSNSCYIDSENCVHTKKSCGPPGRFPASGAVSPRIYYDVLQKDVPSLSGTSFLFCSAEER
ncbi:MAG: hypothetical protein MR832_03840, partial [Clostridiales bacterium]|nr:hypothetical protein [Clostridiales bacterium]